MILVRWTAKSVAVLSMVVRSPVDGCGNHDRALVRPWWHVSVRRRFGGSVSELVPTPADQVEPAPAGHVEPVPAGLPEPAGQAEPTDPAGPGSTPAEDATLLERVLFEVKRVIVGQDRMIERMLAAVLSRGHCLLEGVPGVAKTLAVETLATVVGGSFARIQFTPDLVPADIVGTRIYRPGSERFDVELGPVFVNFLLADEINRAPAKVQSALLEVMAEQQVSLGGQTYLVPLPFLVMATQNPIEQEGVYPLPEAQRDRFLFKILVGYPTDSEEREIVYRMGVSAPVPNQVLTPDRLSALQQRADTVFVHNALVDYAVRLVFATREPARHGLADVAGLIQYGASPRASLGIVRAARALALMRGRDYALPQDLRDIAPDVLRHRLVLSYDALADDVSSDQVVDRVLAAVPVPTVAPRQSATAPPVADFAPPGGGLPALPAFPGRR
jgi:MoxR-like ATPase